MKRDFNLPVKKRSYLVNNSDNIHSCQALCSFENSENYVFHGSTVRDKLTELLYIWSNKTAMNKNSYK